MTITYNKTKRTHLRSDELFSWLNKEFPNLSAMTAMKAKEALDINPIFVGERLYTAAQAEAIAKFIRECDTEYKNGFLVFREQWIRDRAD